MFTYYYVKFYFVGRGVFATKKFVRGDFLLEYRGILLTKEPENVEDTYLYEFNHRGRKYW